VVEEQTLDEQTLAVAIDLPERPLVLGGCCCSHIGAVESLAARNGRIALVWVDAHGDLNTPETSPSGNLWGMPFRMILDSGAVDPQDAILLGAAASTRRAGVHRVDRPPYRCRRLEQALDGTEGAYVALDVDSLEPARSTRSCGARGLTLEEVEQLLQRVRDRTSVLGAGFSGIAADPDNVQPLTRLAWRSGCNSVQRPQV
jgi:arginase